MAPQLFRGSGSIQAWLVLGVCFCVAGCVGGGSKRTKGLPPAGSGPVHELHLLTTPFAVNLNTTPGPDGIAAKLFASSQREAYPVTIREGKVELMLFNGLPEALDLTKTSPRHTWSFTAEDLRKFEQHSPIGIGYQLALPWGTNAPTKARFTILARYQGPTGAHIYSSPSVVSMSK